MKGDIKSVATEIRGIIINNYTLTNWIAQGKNGKNLKTKNLSILYNKNIENMNRPIMKNKIK